MGHRYLVFDFSKFDMGEDPQIRILRDDVLEGPESLWAEIEVARKDGKKIAIYRLGSCVLDWS